MYKFNSESNVVSAMLEWKKESVRRNLTTAEYHEILDTVSDNMVHSEFFESVEAILLAAL